MAYMYMALYFWSKKEPLVWLTTCMNVHVHVNPLFWTTYSSHNFEVVCYMARLSGVVCM